jgi:hypothetical protein
MTTPASSRLFDERGKLWKHAVSNELVEFAESGKWNSDADVTSVTDDISDPDRVMRIRDEGPERTGLPALDWAADDYVKGRAYLQFCLRIQRRGHGFRRDFIAIAERRNDLDGELRLSRDAVVKSEAGSGYWDVAMLVHVGQLVDERQVVKLRKVSSMIRLVPLDLVLGRFRDIRHLVPDGDWILLQEDRELGLVPWFLGRQKRQTPREVIQRTPEAIDVVPGDGTKPSVDCGFVAWDLDPENLDTIAQFRFRQNAVELRCRDSAEFIVERCKVFLRPIKFHPYTFERWHVLDVRRPGVSL